MQLFIIECVLLNKVLIRLSRSYLLKIRNRYPTSDDELNIKEKTNGVLINEKVHVRTLLFLSYFVA